MTDFARGPGKSKINNDLAIIAVFGASAVVLCLIISFFGDPSSVTPRDPVSIAFSP